MRKLLFAAIGLITLIISCTQIMRYHRLEKQKPYFIGKFQLNVSKSDFAGLYPDSSTYANLMLTINGDGTFKFSENPHFINGDTGTWRLGESDVEVFCNFIFKNSGVVDQFGAGLNSSIYTLDPPSKDGTKRVRRLYFERMR